MTRKILLVDDSATSRFRNSVVVRRAGHHLLVAADGEEAVATALAERPDLILMDVEMPKMDGFEACRILRQHDETRTTPVIMVTSRSEAVCREMGRRSGCTDYLTKPVEGPVLLAKIRSYLDAAQGPEAAGNDGSHLNG